jgi:hypothetical protein
MQQALSYATVVITLVVATFASIAGGAVGGIAVGRKALGNELAAMLGGFYGPLAGVAGITIGLIALAMIG